MSGDDKGSVPEHPVGIHRLFRDPRAQIRLIRLDHKESDDDISASLETWYIESAPPYNAISYAWGEPSGRHAITINGFRLLVHKNCFHALRQTRLHHPDDYAWLDAICINQLDLEEKSAQVAMMGAIYANAVLVLACIGPSDAFIRTAHELYGTAIFQDTGDWDEPEGEGTFEADMSTLSFKWHTKNHAGIDVFFPRDDEDQNLITRLCSEWNGLAGRQYFRRAWIVQEVSGGRKRAMMLAGEDIMEWARVTALGLRLSRITQNVITGADVQKLDNQLWWLSQLIYDKNRYLTTFLDHMRFLKCQDIRDRIFSIVSLVDWGAIQLLPDYNTTRYQLASDLMWRLPELNMQDVADIVAILELDEESDQILEVLQKEGLAVRPSTSSSDDFATWSSPLDSAYFVSQDPMGRFQVVSQRQGKPAIDNGCDTWSLHSYGELDASDAVQLYTGDTLVGYGSGSVRPGDILILGYQLELIIRACSDASTFSVVGGACVSQEFRTWVHATRHAEICECWQGPYSEYIIAGVEISFEATRREVLADRVAREVVGKDGRDVKSYLQRYAIGTLRAGSHVKDNTFFGDGVIGPPKPLCSAHRASERHRILGNALWYIALSGNEGIIKVRDKEEALIDQTPCGTTNTVGNQHLSGS
jgi:hypothetical protein